MVEIYYDEYLLLDTRLEDYYLLEPKCVMGANMVDSLSFRMAKGHPMEEKLRRYAGKITVRRDGKLIFRGRIVELRSDIYGTRTVECEGDLGCCNDSIVRPFVFPDEFEMAEGENPVEVFLRWLIENHNSQSEEWQRLKLGQVTVDAPDDVLRRHTGEYLTTWEAMKTRLFASGLEGYLYPRYEEDGTYVDYVGAFPLTNVQQVTLEENLLSLLRESSPASFATAILPLGALNEETGVRPGIAGEPDRELTEDLVKEGDSIYSRSGVEHFGRIYVPMEEATWEDVSRPATLVEHGARYLAGLSREDNITVTAADLGLSEQKAFLSCRNVRLTLPGEEEKLYPLVKLEAYLLQPERTKITIGGEHGALTAGYIDGQTQVKSRVEIIEGALQQQSQRAQSLREVLTTVRTELTRDAQEILLTALKDYVETGDFDTYRQTLEARLSVMADGITASFSDVSEHIQQVQGDQIDQFQRLSKVIRLDENGITVTDPAGRMSLRLDAGSISFLKDGLQQGRWDGDNFYTGNLMVQLTERAQFGDYAWVPRSDGTLMLLYVGGR